MTTNCASPEIRPNDEASLHRRSRSETTADAVRKAAMELAYEGGLALATMERIAKRSKVAKTTIYRRWPHAAAVVMEGFLHELAPLISYQPKASAQATIASSITSLVKALRGQRGDLLRHLLGAAQGDSRLQRAFQEHWILPRRAQAQPVLDQARKRGELRSDVNDNVLIDSLYGAIYYRLMIPYAELSEIYVETLVAQVFAGALNPACPFPNT